MPPTTTTITTRLNSNNSQCIPFARAPCAARLQGRDDDQLLEDERAPDRKQPTARPFCSLESIRRIVGIITVVTVARPPIHRTIPSR